MKSRLLSLGLVILLVALTLAIACSPASTPAPTSAPPASPTAKATTPPPAVKVIEWKYSISGASRAITKPIEWYMKEMESQSGGRLKIIPFFNNALAPQAEQIDGLKAGSYQLGFAPTSDVPAKAPLSTGPELPFLIPAGDVKMGSLLWDYMHFKPVTDEIAKWNAVPFFPMPIPQYQLISKKKVTSVADFQGLRVRATKSQGDVLKQFGAVPTMVASTDIYSAMQKGTLDAAIVASYIAESYKLAEVCKYWVTGLDLGTYAMYSWANKDAWNALPADIQQLHAKLIPGVISRYTIYDEEEKAYKWPNVERVQFPVAEKAKLKAKSDEIVIKDWLADKTTRGLPGQAAIDEINRLVKKYWQ